MASHSSALGRLSGAHGVGLSLCLAAVWSLVACSVPPQSEAGAGTANDLPIVMASRGGRAIGGYDPVSYFLDARTRKGLPEISHRWRDATWLFATVAHRDLFAADPSQYAPAYGGWCAFGVAEGYPAESDPENAWTIHRGKLYLNWDAEVRRDWRLDTEALLEKSEANWPEVRRTPQDGSASIYWHDE
jgi:hypothetical protein